VAGFGLPFHHLVEGAFGYIDTILVIAHGHDFYESDPTIGGHWNFISRKIITKYHKRPALLLMLFDAVNLCFLE